MGVQTAHVLVVGDANLDLIVSGDVVPRFGQQEQLLTDSQLVLGGSAGITACALVKLGLRATIAASVGRDHFGTVVTDHLEREGVDVSHLATTPGLATGISVVLNGPERAILTHQGAMTALHPLASGSEPLPPVEHIHVSGLFLQPSLALVLPSLFERAHAAGMTTSLDTNWDPARNWGAARAALPHTDVLLPNEPELLALAGPIDESDPDAAREKAAHRLTRHGCLIALKRGEAGGEVWGPEGLRLTSPGLMVEVADTVGAGDTFNAGFLSGYLKREPLQLCLDRAVASGSLSTRGVGGTATQPTEAELDHLLRRTA